VQYIRFTCQVDVGAGHQQLLHRRLAAFVCRKNKSCLTISVSLVNTGAFPQQRLHHCPRMLPK
jgi:hypothetical protein